ncbi:hypothetical protein GW915_05160 [bacterium]|nr:hypothetical protein [bacterium]
MTASGDTKTNLCTQCHSKKFSACCGLCEAKLCKKCRITLDFKDFLLLEEKPDYTSHPPYCPNCYDEKVYPDLLEYRQFETMANEVYFFTTNYREYIHVFSKHTKKVLVHKCDDRRQTILMLAYQAAKLGFNAIISAEIKSKKILVDQGYQSTEWSGSAMPANVDGEKLDLLALKGF